jgi:hypothetical protein
VAGNAYSVPDFDAGILEANGWVLSANTGAGTTSQRPTTPRVKDSYFDSTLGYTVIWDGKAWRHPNTGTSV